MLNNFSIITLGILIPAFSVFGFKLLVFSLNYPAIGALIIIPVCIILFITLIDLNLSLKETFYLFIMHACVYLFMAQLPREYIHIFAFSLLGAHLQKKFPKLLSIHLLTGALVSFFDEYLQLYVPSRFFDQNDILLNYVSYLTGVIIVKASYRNILNGV